MLNRFIPVALMGAAVFLGGCAQGGAPVPPVLPTLGTGPITLYMIGDSTMTAYKEDRRPQMGWGEKMPLFFRPDIKIVNWARGGRSSRSFYYEDSRWPVIRDRIKPGDYVLIQFGHNDQKHGSKYEQYGTYAFCSDGSDDGEDCLDEEHSYYQFLKRYVLETREHGGNPILMSPIVRKYFKDGQITVKGQHDLTDAYSEESYPRGDYVAAMRAVSERYGVPFVDLTDATRHIVEQYGNAAATRSLYIAADNTHPQVLFATLIARAAAEGMKAEGVLADEIVEPPLLVSSPGGLDWGSRYVGDASVKRIALEGLSLRPGSGNVKVTVPAGYAVSLDGSHWAAAQDLAYSDGKFTTDLSVRFTPDTIRDYAGTMRFDDASGARLDGIALKGAGVRPGSGIDADVLWSMTGTDAAQVNGPITAADAAVVGLKPASPAVMAVDGQDATVTRFVVDNREHSGQHYLQYALTPKKGTLRVSSISAYLGAGGGDTLQADVEYSLKANFSGPHRLTAENSLAFRKDVISRAGFDTDFPVVAGQTLYIRIYPWNTADSRGKSLAVYDVRVKGRQMP